MSSCTHPESEQSWRARLTGRLARRPAGRAVLHFGTWCRTRRNFSWHWAGVKREVREALGLRRRA